MFKSYLTSAFRNLIRNRTYSVINVAGLSIGLTCSILILVWAQTELSFDTFHVHASNLYRVNSHWNYDGNVSTWNTVPAPLATFGKHEIPAIQQTARVFNRNSQHVFSNGTAHHLEEKVIAYADPIFFTLFDFDFITGTRTRPFEHSHSIVLSETFAKKYFGAEDPIGKTLRMDDADDFVVSAVIRDMPQHSSFRYDVILNFNLLLERFVPHENAQSLDTDWTRFSYYTYVLLDPAASPLAVGKHLSEIHDRNSEYHIPEYQLQSITDLHLYTPGMSDNGMQTVKIFIIASIVLLVIACINYVNLATALASKRAKEVGIRKTIGADRGRLIYQFMLEASLIITLSVLLSVAMIQVCLPFYNSFLDRTFTLGSILLGNGYLLMLIVFLTWVISAVYPALVLSHFKPIQVLKGKLYVSGERTPLRQVLVITQFALSIAIIIGALVMQQQLYFIGTKNLGLEKENTLSFHLTAETSAKTEMLRHEIIIDRGVAAMGFSNENILQTTTSTLGHAWEGKDENFNLIIVPLSVDRDFFATLKIELAYGVAFDGSPSDSSKIVLNETAVKATGLKDPIGKWFHIASVRGKVVGVVKDFHHGSLRSPILPMAFYYNPTRFRIAYVKLNEGHTSSVLNHVETVWGQFNERHPFRFSFLDDTYHSMYQSESKTNVLFSIFTVVTTLIACIGLLGLASFTTTQRVKEIGVRKILGANVFQIVVLVSKGFLKLIVIALMVTMPLSYLMMKNWLMDFTYRTEINWISVFLLAGGLALVVACITISFHTIKASFRNPVKSLRET